jgi:hypothetical protein
MQWRTKNASDYAVRCWLAPLLRPCSEWQWASDENAKSAKLTCVPTGQLRLPFSAAALLVSAATGPETRKNRTTTGAAMMEGVLLLCFFGDMVFDILGS